jgi:hypothetical protein
VSKSHTFLGHLIDVFLIDVFPSLSVLTPNIPEGGTKSRVETQVRVAVELADTSSSAGDPQRYDRIGSWTWLKLPPGTATKKRTRKQGKIGTIALSFFSCVYKCLMDNSYQTLLPKTFCTLGRR